MIYVQLRFYFAMFVGMIVKKIPICKLTASLRLKVALWMMSVNLKTIEWKIKKGHRK